jgi:hypothetical protein
MNQARIPSPAILVAAKARRRTAGIAITVALGALGAWAASAPAASVSYPDFSDPTGLSVNGDAEIDQGKLLVIPGEGVTGTAFTEAEVVRPNRSFNTRFALKITPTSGQGGDGMAFVIQPTGATEIGEGGGALGYGGIGPGLAVEFDHFQNGEYGDPFEEHVALTLGGDPGNQVKIEPFKLSDKKVRAWVSYSAEKGRIKVFATKGKQKPRHPLFASNQDLDEILGGERAYAGFTAGSGSETAEHKVFSWRLKR